MISYLLVATAVLLGSKFFSRFSWWKFALLVLALFSGARALSLSGYDSFFYQSSYDFEVPSSIFKLSSYSGDYEIGLIGFMSLCKQFGLDYAGFQFAYNIISSLLLGLALSQLPISAKGKATFLFAFFCMRYLYFDWTLLRQYIAVLFSWIAFGILSNEKNGIIPNLLSAFIMICVALLFHSSAIAAIPGCLVVLIAREGNVGWRAMVLAGIITLALLFTPSFSFVVRLYTLLTGDTSYLTTYGTAASSTNVINVAVRWVFALLAWRSLRADKGISPYIGLAVLSATTSAIGSELAFRLAEYYSVGTYACAAISGANLRKRERVAYDYFFYIGFVTILVRFLLSFDGGALLPYSLQF